MITNRIDERWPNFTDEEMRCKCGCERIRMDVEFLDMLQQIRLVTGLPMQVTSGYRCPEYNRVVSRTGLDGPHTSGHAVDIKISGESAFILVHTALDVGCTGLGLKQNGVFERRFIHLDDLESGLRPRVWTYEG